MIITRSPLRISLGGGGTDLPSYYREHSGFVIAAAIDKYFYITLHHTFVEDLIIKYSKMERVRGLDEIEHPIIREALRLTRAPTGGLEITSMADIPAGKTVVSESGFTHREQLEELERVGIDAVLIGETLMRAADIEAACRELTGGEDP